MTSSAARRLLTSIAANVRTQRLRRHWTQDELAEKSDLTARFIREIERGAINIRVVTLAAIATALGIKADRLMKPASKHPPRSAGRPRGIAEKRPRNRG